MKPFLKWAGGKRWLFTSEFIEKLPSFDRYIEPFLGGGAGFFAIAPKKAILNDLNPELINLYEMISTKPQTIARGLKHLHQAHSKEMYYKVRARGYTHGPVGAIRTLYLNRTCWNGLFRLNLKGQFNVPIGTKNAIFDEAESFQDYAKIIKRATLMCGDFEDSINLAGVGDLLFVDPPYTVKHNMNGFVKYNEAIFSWADQERLSFSLQRASERGASVILTNADHQSVRALYDGFGKHSSVARSSIISGQSSGRSKTTEFILVA
ncbi:Dam family site-specific DNA-(adenine-N6)-methyltransferase [Qipengyuania sp. S6317L1]|nr:Dam family site-specific DNA-(adenine-N6)-methyltransferase [Qipengyuania sp. S6317L1]